MWLARATCNSDVPVQAWPTCAAGLTRAAQVHHPAHLTAGAQVQHRRPAPVHAAAAALVALAQLGQQRGGRRCAHPRPAAPAWRPRAAAGSLRSRLTPATVAGARQRSSPKHCCLGTKQGVGGWTACVYREGGEWELGPPARRTCVTLKLSAGEARPGRPEPARAAGSLVWEGAARDAPSRLSDWAALSAPVPLPGVMVDCSSRGTVQRPLNTAAATVASARPRGGRKGRARHNTVRPPCHPPAFCQAGPAGAGAGAATRGAVAAAVGLARRTLRPQNRRRRRIGCAG